MRVAIFFVLALAACGGEGRCASPPCTIPLHTCHGDEDCFQTEFCNFEQDSCGTSAIDHGVCEDRPDLGFDDCGFSVGLACGCDGTYHTSTCAAHQAGTDVDANGNCSLPPGAFSCGSQACLKDKHMCVELGRNGPRAASDLECEQIPDACQFDRTCTCVRSFLGCEECTEVNGELRLNCDFPMPVPDDMAVTSSAAAPRASTSASH